VSDAYELTSARALTPPRYDTFITAYQRPRRRQPEYAGRNFPTCGPSCYSLKSLNRATVTADVLVPGPFRGGVMDTNGGAVLDGTIRLFANAGISRAGEPLNCGNSILATSLGWCNRRRRSWPRSNSKRSLCLSANRSSSIFGAAQQQRFSFLPGSGA